MNRRNWLRAGTLSALGVAAAPLGLRALPHPERKTEAIRLSSNENPYGPSPAARAAIRDSAATCNRYPHAHCEALQQALARRHGVSPEHIFLSAGSWEILRLAGMLYARQGRRLLTCEPTFDWVLRSAEAFGATARRLPLDGAWRYDLAALHREARPEEVIYLCNPNNPTGTALPAAEVEAFCREVLPGHDVFLDEAYLEYLPEGEQASMVRLVEQFPRLIVSRTFSKIYGLAGSRIGYAVAHPDTIRQLEQWHVGMRIAAGASALLAAQASLEDEAFLRESRQRNATTRRWFTDWLDRSGIAYAPEPAANFAFVSAEAFPADLTDQLAAADIQIGRAQSTPRGPYHRITIGADREMERLVARLDKLKA